MNRFNRRRAFLNASFAMGASLLAPRARACEYFTGTLRITHPWTRATGADNFAVLCMKFDEVSETDRLIGVETPVATGAELVGKGVAGAVDLLIPEGRETLLSEEDTYIRLMDLKHPLLIARAYPLVLTFEKSGRVNALLNVDYLRPLFAVPGAHRS